MSRRSRAARLLADGRGARRGGQIGLTALGTTSAADLAGHNFDLVVIGGGITGAGVAWRAAQRNRSVLLLEAEDFAAGTSSRSSKLIHGGLRYLAQAEFNLVRDGVRERHQIHRIAPHLAVPHWMVIPASGWLEYLKYRIGVTAYERLGNVPADERHQNLSGAGLHGFEPALRVDAAPYGCAYREYATDDARLVMAVLRGAAAFGATVVSHTPVRRVERQGPSLSVFFDVDGDTARVGAVEVINATGPWVEDLSGMGGGRLALSKGVHIGVPAGSLPVRHMLMLTAHDNRPVFVIRRGSVSYIGTTDAMTGKGAELWPEVRRDEVEYLLECVNTHCTVDLGVDDVVTSWAGLRPLVYQPGRSTRDISRRDEIFVDKRGVVTIAGGKLTGFRAMADRALRSVRIRPSRDVPVLPGGQPTAADPVNARLQTRYGSEVPDVLRLGASRIAEGADVFEGEVDWGVEVEGAATLEDLVYRRLRLPLYEPLSLPLVLPWITARMQALKGWSDEEAERQRSDLQQLIDRDLDFVE